MNWPQEIDMAIKNVQEAPFLTEAQKRDIFFSNAIRFFKLNKSDFGVYTNPYHQLGASGTEMHRAIRLVVDAGLHTGKMTREEAIKYVMSHEPFSEQAATAEIERYMAWPGQALAYKIGQLKIMELRDKYKKQLGSKFSIRDFHDAILKCGCMPLTVFENYMDDWAKSVK